MVNFFQLLSAILDNDPDRLLISPSEKKIVASYGESKKIQLKDYKDYQSFKSKVLITLENENIGFGSLSFDITNDSKQNSWSNFPLGEFTFPSYVFIFENNTISEYGKNDQLKKQILESSKEKKLTRSIPIKNDNNHSPWIDLVEKAKQDISKSNIQKIVVGESITYENLDIDIKQTLFNMTYEYPDCVTFLFKNSDDYFFGSTPEKVFNYNNGILITDALAGSIPNKGQKEDQIRNMFNNSILQKEHNIVVEFLENQLLKISNNKVKKSKLKIKSLSNVNHLLLELETNVDKNNFFEFINLLHPSPALAGFPVKDAKEWIKSNENFHRGLYTGSIGYVEKNSSYFFAALRCAKFSSKDKNITTFAGNGIIENSKTNYEINELKSKFEAINSSIKVN